MSRKYQNAKIYKLVSNKTADVYVGSCLITLPSRLSTHKNDYNKCSSKKMFQVPDAIISIVLIEALPNCKSKAGMKARELHWMTTIPCININRPFVTDIQQVGGDKKEWQRAYDASPAIIEKAKAHYVANKPALLERQKIYDTTPAIIEHKKEYYEANKPAILEYQKANREKINKQRRERRAAKKLAKLTLATEVETSQHPI